MSVDGFPFLIYQRFVSLYIFLLVVIHHTDQACLLLVFVNCQKLDRWNSCFMSNRVIYGYCCKNHLIYCFKWLCGIDSCSYISYEKGGFKYNISRLDSQLEKIRELGPSLLEGNLPGRKYF